MRNKGWKWLFALMLAAGLLVLLTGSALAGYNSVTVCTDGDGAAVYAAPTGSKTAGILYNGYCTSLPLDDENGRYRHELTEDFAVYVDIEKAESKLPEDDHSLSYTEWRQQIPSKVWVGEIAGENTPVYATPKNKKLAAKHAKGSLVMVCGEFGDDWYIEGWVSGFVEKSALRKVKDLPSTQFRDSDFGF